MGYLLRPATASANQLPHDMSSLVSAPDTAVLAGDDAPARRYGTRARARLRIAARLLGMKVNIEPDSDEHCSRVLARIQQMSAQRREELRAQVDWVERYELTEATLRGSSARWR